MAHRYAADLVSPRERNRRRSLSYVEDYAIEARQTDAAKMGCENVKLFLCEPLPQHRSRPYPGLICEALSGRAGLP